MGLALHVGGIQADHKAQLVLVLVGQQKKMQHHGVVGYVLVKGLAVQVQKGGVDKNVVSALGSQTLQLLEDTDGVSSGLDHIHLRQDILGKDLNGVHVIFLGGRHAEAHLCERDLCVIVPVQLQ